MWIFKALLAGKLVVSFVVVEDTVTESRRICNEMVENIYAEMHVVHDKNPYGMTSHSGAIYLPHHWEFVCERQKT